MYLMLDIKDLWNRVSYLVLCAPDRFPYRDFLSDEDQMTMEKGFAQLREGILVAYPEEKYSDFKYVKLRASLNEILDNALSAYNLLLSTSDLDYEVKGAHLLQDFRDKIFIKKGKVRYL